MNMRPLLVQRWAPLLLLLPLAYLAWPIFWKPLDYRFYNYFQSQRSVPAAEHVAVVEIGEETIASQFGKPAFPLSRHAGQHARLTRRLFEAGARTIVFDLEFSEKLFDSDPVALAEAMREAGNVVLVMSLPEERIIRRGGEATVVQSSSTTPHPLLLRAAAQVCIVDVPIDPDGVLRRFRPSPRARELQVWTLPEYLAQTLLLGPMPIDFPTTANPIPTRSYHQVLTGSGDLSVFSGRIVFIGSSLDAAGDFIVAPSNQRTRDGNTSYTLPAVTALAAITETLLRDQPLRDARWFIALLWNLIWSAAAVSLMPKGRAFTSVIIFIAIMLAALICTGLMHTGAGIIFPAGLLTGCLLFAGGFTLVYSYLQTSRSLVRTLRASRDELERKVQERTEDLSKANAELIETLETLRRTQSQLIQAEKMASLGSLAAGVAHEINNPAGAVAGSVDVIHRCIEKILQNVDSKESERSAAIHKALNIMKNSTDVVGGAGERITTIVNSLKNFTRLDEADCQVVNIHEGLDSTVTLLQHKLGDEIAVTREYGDLPPIECYPGELNQAFMNIINRAIQSIAGRGEITIATSRDGDLLTIRITDTGAAIAPEHLDRIFDPDFTTTGNRVGSELGLSISYTIIQKHQGEITVESTPGAGTTFTIVLPVRSSLDNNTQ